MVLPHEFKEFVENDINKIDEIASFNASAKELIKFHKEIDSKYQSCILNWHQGLNEAMFPKGGQPFFDYYYLKESRDDILENLKLMKSKLSVYLYGMNAISIPEPPTTNVNVTTNVNLSITFEQVRSQIEDMTSLTDEETQEIKSKLDELEKIVNSKDKKKTKWEKAKSILVWLADKSFDVGMALLPLLLKIQE